MGGRRLFPKIHDGDGAAAVIFGFERGTFHKRVAAQKLCDTFTKCACAVTMNYPDALLTRQRGFIEIFVEAFGGFFDAQADNV